MELKPLFYCIPRIEILGYDMGRGSASFFGSEPEFFKIMASLYLIDFSVKQPFFN